MKHFYANVDFIYMTISFLKSAVSVAVKRDRA